MFSRGHSCLRRKIFKTYACIDRLKHSRKRVMLLSKRTGIGLVTTALVRFNVTDV